MTVRTLSSITSANRIKFRCKRGDRPDEIGFGKLRPGGDHYSSFCSGKNNGHLSEAMMMEAESVFMPTRLLLLLVCGGGVLVLIGVVVAVILLLTGRKEPRPSDRDERQS